MQRFGTAVAISLSVKPEECDLQRIQSSKVKPPLN